MARRRHGRGLGDMGGVRAVRAAAGVVVMPARGGAILLNAEPVPCRPPIIFEPPLQLVDGLPELWVVTTGPREQWGGAQVGWSEDGDTYHLGPMVGGEAVAGTLLDDLGPGADGQGVRVALDDAGKLASVDAAAASRFQSECYLGDGRNRFEIVAYTGMTLLGRDDHAFVYRLHGLLVRGGYGTAVRAWPAGTRFARLNAEVSRIPLPYRLVAAHATLSIKLLSMNAVGDVDSLDDPADTEPIIVNLRGALEEWPTWQRVRP